jgi:hypothetical protein
MDVPLNIAERAEQWDIRTLRQIYELIEKETRLKRRFNSGATNG